MSPHAFPRTIVRAQAQARQPWLWQRYCLAVGVLLICWGSGGFARGQEIPAAPDATANPDEEMVQLNFPDEIEIRALVDYVSQSLGTKILYDEQIANKKISIRAPRPIPASSAMSVLESALRMKSLVIVDADAPGWKRITDASKLPSVAPAGTARSAIELYGLGTPVTEAFLLKHVDAEQVDQLIKPFLTEPGANSLPLPESSTIIVTDYASNLLKIEKWIRFVDRPRPDVVLEFYEVQHVEAEAIAKQVTTLLAAKNKAEGGRQPAAGVEVTHDGRTNRLVLIGPQQEMAVTKRLIEELDVPLGLTSQTYRFRFVEATRIDNIIKQTFATPAAQGLYQSIVDEKENILIARTTAEIHREIEKYTKTLDSTPDKAESPVRFYKIKNLPAMDLLSTIRSIEQNPTLPGTDNPTWQRLPTDGRIRSGRAQGPTGPNQLPRDPLATNLPTPPAVVAPTDGPLGTGMPDGNGVPQGPDLVSMPTGLETGNAALFLGRASVTADIHTNSLIVVAEPAVQALYAELIAKLDQRRPQVLIDTKFVIINNSDDFSLGVEISAGDRMGARRLLQFTQYGLSTVDPVSGALSIIPGLGFNGTLVDPENADVVVRTLTTHRRARVMSAPRIVVNDNATGQLSSVSEVPFTSINASDTVATTSFAGFAEAGTTITVTPHISDDNHLQLDFAITLNAFTGTGGGGVPPPRQTDEVTSQVTIADGHTVIVGGLNRRNESDDYRGIPGLDKIPIVRLLSGIQSTSDNRTSMFVFIKPIILRDDKFQDLRYFSDRDLKCARVCPDLPESSPIWIK